MAYTPEQIENLKLITCRNCIHSKCGSENVNKCSLDDLRCSINDQSIRLLSSNPNSSCPKNYFSFLNTEKFKPGFKILETMGGGCGCGG